MNRPTLTLLASGLLFANRIFPCTIGRAGISTIKKEGDGATPAGRHQVVGCLYRPDRMKRPAPWARPIRRNDLWCDAPDHPAYNHLVSGPFPASHERLWRADRLYDLILLTSWNWPDAVPGQGSAIFLHRWRAPGLPTEGCIALAAPHLLHVARNAPPGTAISIQPLAPKIAEPTRT